MHSPMFLDIENVSNNYLFIMVYFYYSLRVVQSQSQWYLMQYSLLIVS